MRTIIVDGDAVAWACCHADRDHHAIAVNKVRGYRRDLSADRVIVCCSDPARRYFRHDLFDGYKPDRSAVPEVLPHIVAALHDEFRVRTLPGLEGDDVMGILGTWPGMQGERIMVARDKDLLGIPGWHYDPHRRTRTVQSEDAANWHHLWQAIVGDGIDGYKGLPGVGPDRVKRILPAPEPGTDWYRRAWVNLVLAFKAKGFADDDALLQARLARILRTSDYDLAERRVIPWQPPA